MTSKNEKEHEAEIDVVLIVKGAGEQAEDDHLNIFLRGFWPAIKSLDKNATLTQLTSGFDDYPPSPHNSDGKSHRHVTEIRARHQFEEKVGKGIQERQTSRRLWLKESYWEAETLPSSALGNLSREWRMASFVFANMFRNAVFTRNTKWLKDQRSNKNFAFQRGKTPGTRFWDYFGYYFSYLLLFMLVLLPFINSLPTVAWFNEALKNILADEIFNLPGFNGLLFVIFTGAVWAIAPTLEHSVMSYQYAKYRKLKSLPVLPNWVLLALIFFLVSAPLAYLRFVLILLALQASLVVARGFLWRFRTYANSDVDIADYYSYEEDGRKLMGKVDEVFLTRLFFTPLIYRYLIFITLPIGFIGALLVSLLKWTKFLGGIGASLDKTLNVMLVGYMDDVVNYAMDPAQSNRVRSAVINDIVYFYNKPGVKRIHVVAHSQGTPITYEALFHFLDKKYQDKIFTYATIGSVLSYYHHARGVLDPVYYERFPVSVSTEQNFPKGFKWLNFWNFSDPITEFYGLDEYTYFEKAPPLDAKFARGIASPTNIRTKTSLENHGEYWNNLEKFATPFAKRTLGELRPKEWNPDLGEKGGRFTDKGTDTRKKSEEFAPTWWQRYRHHLAVVALWLFLLVGAFFAIRWLMVQPVIHLVSDYFIRLHKNALDVFRFYFPSNDSATPKQLNALWSQILDGSLILIGIWLFVDWISQLGRTFGLIVKK
ncbi:MAG TPA: alpha/beta hydrolase [Anaerolineales bacterium]|nr:alpha/beta hydrolase [Anaerolineales bacterium]HMR99413.1 alpha/beta hydrolase [Anaerolineales bacterium]HNQ95155.1 alpha/beta hydrolase [Anaerolineales bacterium]HNS60170.1 alpha/beta hydrolase [Anaerolineales bacterium]